MNATTDSPSQGTETDCPTLRANAASTPSAYYMSGLLSVRAYYVSC